jgi:serine/threonine protein phosphatase 1
MAEVGDYAFVHAGVRPGVPLAEQAERDLLWIRREFLGEKGPHPKVIVHGHTPLEEAQLTRWRLGVDTGCYATGLLTAVRLHGEEQRLIQARAVRRSD